MSVEVAGSEKAVQVAQREAVVNQERRLELSEER